jgi:pSer/pThr/pTyr-binding forkhead associated (FHA) protein
MPATVTLTVVEGNLKGKEYVFREPSKYFVGRAAACHVHLPTDEHHGTVSRFHCVLDIDPPRIRVRDLGSLNGTYVNGTLIGQRHPHVQPEEAIGLLLPDYDLEEGDELRVGDTVLRVGISGLEVESDAEAEMELAAC